MRISKHLIGAFFIVLTLCTFVISQEKSGLTSLSEKASFAETQKWLVKALEKYGAFYSHGAYNAIDNVKFKGCQLNYKLVSSHHYDNARDPRISDGGLVTEELRRKFDPNQLYNNGKNAIFGSTSMRSYSVSFSLSDLDLKSISERVSIYNVPEQMQTINIKTIGLRKNVTAKSLKGESLSDQVSLSIRKKVSDQVKAGFVQAIKLCQAKK